MVAATRISGRGRAGRPGRPGTHGIRVPLVRMCQSGSEMWWLAQSEIAIQYTNSDYFQWLCPGGPLQTEAKGHLNANIMAWYCIGVDMGVK